MFGFANLGRYLAEQKLAEKAEHVEVTREEFVRLAIESGETPEHAEQTAKMCLAFGSETMIGGKMLSIKAAE